MIPRVNVSNSDSNSLLRVCCFNVRGLSHNVPFILDLLNRVDVIAISEHWLHEYSLDTIHNLSKNFATAPSLVEDSVFCVPRLVRGHGGVALGWHTSLDHMVSPASFTPTSRIVGTQLSSPHHSLYFISVYLPCRSGCTDDFKETLDHIDAILQLLPTSADVIIMGDFNADLGPEGGPKCTTPENEQGKIFLQYLRSWNYISTHLYLSPMSASFTYESEAHSSLSTIDHIICPRHLLPSFCSSSPLQDLPLNTSDHHPVCATLRCTFSSTISHRDHPNYSPPNWSGCSKDVIFSTYTSPLQPILHDLMLAIPPLSALSHEPLLIDKHLESVTTSLLSVAAKLPCKRYHPHQSPAWTPQLKSASTTCKRLYRNWVSCGRPRDPANPLRRPTRMLKRIFVLNFVVFFHRRTINDNFFASLDIDCSNPQRFFSKIRRHINPSSADLPTQ